MQSQIETRLQDLPSWFMAIITGLGLVLLLLLVFVLLLCVMASSTFFGLIPRLNKIIETLSRLEAQLKQSKKEEGPWEQDDQPERAVRIASFLPAYGKAGPSPAST